jgi:sec-independent protein translocase protein TatB
MSGVSSAELLLLLVIGLIVLGPKRLPEIANKIGGWVGQARRMTRVMKRQLEEELNIDDLNNIKAPQIDLLPDPTAAPDPADPAYDDTDYVAEADEASVETEAADHIPNDDDTFSPLHEKDDKE